jgi:hypothetical protein
MNSSNRRPRKSNGLLLIALVVAFLAAIFDDRERDRDTEPSNGASGVSTPVTNPIEEALRPAAAGQPPQEGIVAAILVDTSGSMEDEVKDVDGQMRPKIEIARRAALDLVRQFENYAREHAEQTILLGIYEFSDRGRESSREVVKLGPPGTMDNVAVRTAISNMRPGGDTPIGDAMIQAKRAIDATGLSKRHLLVITDGENNIGYEPEDVTRIITGQGDQDRASIYFVAFDIAATKFTPVRDAGGLVLAASNESELKGTLDYLLTGKILAEQPEKR